MLPGSVAWKSCRFARVSCRFASDFGPSRNKTYIISAPCRPQLGVTNRYDVKVFCQTLSSSPWTKIALAHYLKYADNSNIPDDSWWKCSTQKMHRLNVSLCLIDSDNQFFLVKITENHPPPKYTVSKLPWLYLRTCKARIISFSSI